MKHLSIISLIVIVIIGCSTSPSLMYENKNAIWKVHTNGSGATKIVDLATHAQWIPKVKDKIAFARTKTSYTEYAIFIADDDGKNQLQLTTFSALEDYSWSPDRKWIAFSSDQNGNWEIYKINVSTKQLVNLTNNSSSDQKPRWSPKGDKIAFQSDRRNGDWDIWIIDNNGSNLQNLTNGVVGNGYDGEGVWSPDGKYIAHHGNHIGWGGPKICLAILPTSGNPSATGPYSDQHASLGVDAIWSPSGEFLFYIDDKGGLYKKETSTKKEKLIANTGSSPSASSIMDINETTLFFVKGIDLYSVKWRVGGEQKLVEGYNPDVW